MNILYAMLGGFALDWIFGDPAWLTHPVVIMGKAIAALESGLRKRLPQTPRGERLAGLTMAIVLPVGTLLLTGGDTLLQCMNSVGVHELEPICEMERGIVLARFGCNGTARYVITKSGGFGHADLLTELAKQIATDTEETT